MLINKCSESQKVHVIYFWQFNTEYMLMYFPGQKCKNVNI